MTSFEPVVPNGDLDIHPDPQGLWSRVAVIGGWQDAKVTRKRWPNASVVGPLRTMRGIDLLVRDLLANPQIRVLVWDGPAPGLGAKVQATLVELWYAGGSERWADTVGEDVMAAVWDPDHQGVPQQCHLLHAYIDLAMIAGEPFATELRQKIDLASMHYASPMIEDCDRPGGRIILPPPPPKAEVPAPHGDPGDRVAADMLREVWPLVLRNAMRFGRTVPTQYGQTREVLNLVSVIRDPAASAPGLPWEVGVEQVEDYKRQLVESVVPEGAPYSYGSRLRGACSWAAPYVVACKRCKASFAKAESDLTCPKCGRKGERQTDGIPGAAVDQIEAVEKLLREAPGTRAAYLTPWRPDEDAGKESGRPCLVGITFRAVETKPEGPVKWDDGWKHRFAHAGEPAEYMLHTTVVFRSHYLFGAYLLNLAAVCMWACELAEKLGMGAGPVTCVSQSAHVYDRDWEAAERVIAEAKWPAIRMDQRCTFVVEVVSDPPEIDETEGPFEGRHEHFRVCKTCKRYVRPSFDGPEIKHAADCSPNGRIRVQALTPDGDRVIDVWEGRTASALALQIERSGLITEIGNACWLGGELARAEAKLRGAP